MNIQCRLITVVLILLTWVGCGVVSGQAKAHPKIVPLAYLAQAKKDPGSFVSFYVNQQGPVSLLATARKVSGTYQGYEKMSDREYRSMDSLCRTYLPQGMMLPAIGDSVTVYYAGTGFQKTLAYTGFIYEKSKLSSVYKVPVRMDQVLLYIENIDSILFGNSLSLDRYDLYALLKSNLLPVNTVFKVQEKSGLTRVPLNNIDETDKHYNGNPNQTIILLTVVGCVTASIIAIVLVAKAEREAQQSAEETANGCLDAANYFFTWGDEEKSCTGILYKR
jgi:hypothetical protein